MGDMSGTSDGDRLTDGAGAASVERYSVFRFIVADKAALYREVVEVFARAKARYRIQLRTAEVARELADGRARLSVETDELAAALDQLTGWGNLKRTQDTREVATLEEFYRRRSLYQLTPEGEEAYRGVVGLEELQHRSGGRLSGFMLPRIEERLEALLQELRLTTPDANRLYTLLGELHAFSSDLADNARRFMDQLAESLETLVSTDEAFLAYKKAVLLYLESFVGLLNEHQPRIIAAIRAVESEGAERMIALAAATDQAPSPDGSDRGPVRELSIRWRALAEWFSGGPHQAAEAEHLRDAALEAVNRIFRVLDHLNEKRYRRVNRAADYMLLAKWFSNSTQAEANSLFMAAFGLFSARHFDLPSEDEEAERGKSFFAAAPVTVAPRLRKAGRRGFTGRVGAAADYSEGRKAALQSIWEQDRRLSRAETRFLNQTVQLSDLGEVTPDELHLLLDLLDAGLRTGTPPGETAPAFAGGGRYEVRLAPPEKDAVAVVRSEFGRLRLPDYGLTLLIRGGLEERK